MPKQNSIVLKSIDEILTESFFIPFYQRGYRWTKRQAEDLLDDIYEFQKQEKAGAGTPFYCLQPVVVKKRDQAWELIDGQQRLTTIHILLNYLRDQMAPGQTPYTISYETRPASKKFLENMDVAMSHENIDFFHMHEVQKAIAAWFEKKDQTCKSDFLYTLLGHDGASGYVKIIWYQINEETDVTEVFKRLNIGKIPLTNAELVKALLLKHSNFQKTEQHVRQFQIAQEWDEIERALQAEDFWYFLSNKTQEDNRITLVLDLVACHLASKEFSIRRDDPSYIFLTFSYWLETTTEQDPFQACWGYIKRAFMMLQEWYQNHTLFHLIGFLVATGKSIPEIEEIFVASITKRDFVKKLVEAIHRSVIDKKKGSEGPFNIASYIANLSYYERKGVVKTLLLFNIVALLPDMQADPQGSAAKTDTRFRFDCYKMQEWDVEHIHSRSDDLPKLPKKQREWLLHTLDFIKSTSGSSLQDEERQNLIKSAEKLMEESTFKQEDFKRVSEKILAFYNDNVEKSDARAEVWEDSIGNLALLDSKTNRSYQNAIFPIKRRDIIALDKTARFVPLCTKNVFLKYYSSNVSDMMRWKTQDMLDYQKTITQTLQKFFVGQGATV